MSVQPDSDVPQWKKDLIARLRSQNRRTNRQLFDPSPGQQPQLVAREETCEMVQERAWQKESDSDEDLHYGPGIVSKLKERYLSLAQREAKTRPPILRKAASLENILDEPPASRLYAPKADGEAKSRYRSPKRGAVEMKRARSVETISHNDKKEAKRESLHEDVLVAMVDGCGKNVAYTPKVNRPKRIPPVMNEKEKPPVDVVKQAKMIFERRPEQRTKPPQVTGEVAAKVATYKNIIVQNKQMKKPQIKTKPVLTNGVRLKNIPKPSSLEVKENEKEKINGTNLPSPIPDVSRVVSKTEDLSSNKKMSLCETPDLIITSSPLPAVNSPSFRISATENFIKEEIRLANEEKKSSPSIIEKKNQPMTFHFAKNKNVSNTQTPPSQPLKLEINGDNVAKNVTILEMEKNLINAKRTLESNSVKSAEEVTVKVVPTKVKKSPPPRQQEQENNSIVFKFTDRKDVPDYVQNDGVKRVQKIEKPKVGEGGIILLPGASIGESFTDENEEILRSLECPPSPCDVIFINDNILIDGKSSLSQKSKKAKMKISFVEEGPEIYEYPSETSLLIEDTPTSPPLAQLRSSPLSGCSSLGNYTPKSTEDFQPGVTRSVQSVAPPKSEPEMNEIILQEVEKPIVFSTGANSDILF